MYVTLAAPHHCGLSADCVCCVFQACQSAVGSTEFYEHNKVEGWNSAIIVCPTAFQLCCVRTWPPLRASSVPPGCHPAYKTGASR